MIGKVLYYRSFLDILLCIAPRCDSMTITLTYSVNIYHKCHIGFLNKNYKRTKLKLARCP